MKELSIQEKATRYDEAIERAESIYNETAIPSATTKGICTYIFPELKESEDEKIRKCIEDLIKENTFSNIYGVTKDDCLAWLEKQGEQKRLDFPYVTGLRENRLDNKPQIKHSVLMLTTHGVAEGECLGEELCQYRWSCKVKDADVLYWLHLSDLESLEKENFEKKPADKVEPKFIKVEKDKWYVCISQYCNFIEGRNYKATLDGRIVDDYGTEYDMHSDAYKCFRPWTIKDAKDGDVLVSESTCGLGTWYCIFKSLDGDESITVYCYLARDGRFETKKELCFDKDPYNTNPATKEQRDTLIKAMADAGYTFDFEKKELKEIEPAEWSEYCCINQLIVFCENCMVQDSNAKKCASFLKSLKERYTWKPSEEQMNTLEYYMHTLVCNEHKEVLFGLYADLKKLREK